MTIAAWPAWCNDSACVLRVSSQVKSRHILSNISPFEPVLYLPLLLLFGLAFPHVPDPSDLTLSAK